MQLQHVSKGVDTPKEFGKDLPGLGLRHRSCDGQSRLSAPHQTLFHTHCPVLAEGHLKEQRRVAISTLCTKRLKRKLKTIKIEVADAGAANWTFYSYWRHSLHTSALNFHLKNTIKAFLIKNFDHYQLVPKSLGKSSGLPCHSFPICLTGTEALCSSLLREGCSQRAKSSHVKENLNHRPASRKLTFSFLEHFRYAAAESKAIVHTNSFNVSFLLTNVRAGSHKDASASIDESCDGLHIDISSKILRDKWQSLASPADNSMILYHCLDQGRRKRYKGAEGGW